MLSTLTDFEEKPGASLGLIDENFEQAGRCHILAVVRYAGAGYRLLKDTLAASFRATDFAPLTDEVFGGESGAHCGRANAICVPLLL